MDGLDDRLWNTDVNPQTYTDAEEGYRAAVLDQYRTCVEMADRVSGRRSLTNTFFLSLNSAVVAAVVAVAGNSSQEVPLLLLLAGLVVLWAQCLTWFVMVRSYRQLNTAKFAVIGALERRLPALAYSDAEWFALGEGRDWRKYLPLTRVEQGVPLIFGAAYLLVFLSFAL
ncbi:RipA family octameric membrane protein [Nocardiopsis tropica]|jgi:hypothetical protein|uniref:Small integral membrane protein n=1 Tax=Nocardiopsis tropica TaxID=109330 RepID=A0ABU7KTY6_9ACTN|nr:hypothetical protein [Nocardiopsis umidischolae]MEE2052751.1 hypothetical protein [Nocardiopsis umidischolae]